ncbi:MAG TPA: sigma 54-interacting transcriptional regulator [Polyangiaceae bacterium]|jgi:transcriptional regulator with AAA-type ATPase domain|nr:sigma 54-interacting transcriptional regulator [Polyangiaceae bacterium]
MSEVFDRTLDVESAAPLQRESERREPHLLVALECDRPTAMSTRHRLGQGGSVVVGRGAARAATRIPDHRATKLDLKISDPRMSSVHARLDGALGRWKITDLGSKNGVRVNGQVVREQPLADGDVLELGHTVLLYEESTHGEDADDVDLATVEPLAPGLGTLVPGLLSDFDKLTRLSPTGVAVLVQGETGTGKELAARALHTLSGRTGKFVSVNSGAIPHALLESELFGSAKGAFSGAVGDRPGLIRSADRGTFFLDEIGDLPLASQAAFLRVLQEQRVRPVGGTEAVSVDIRLVSATNRSVESLVREGKFRDDLFARIAGFRMTLPPLRERRSDLGLLVGALLARIGGERANRVTLTIEAARILYSYRFPLNVRELESWLTTAVALAGDAPIRPEHFPERLTLGEELESDELDDDPEASQRPLTADQLQHKETVLSLLREHRGNVSAVARAAGKARNQIQRWLRRYALDPNDYR